MARAAFAAMGYMLEIDFYPWARTIAMARRPGLYDGYFPEYYAKDLEDEFIFSDPMGESPLGFVERRDNPIEWNSLDDLKGVRVGTVQGYVNTREFDQMVAEGQIPVEGVATDKFIIRMVAAERIPMAVIDYYVLIWLLEQDETLRPFRKEVQFNEKLLEMKDLYICFQKNERGEDLARIFNEGLAKIDVGSIMNDYMRPLFSESSRGGDKQ